MPYIETTLSAPLPKDTEKSIAAAYGKLIEAFPGKTEAWLMLDFRGDAHMYFQGSEEPCAIVKIALFGRGNTASYDKMTADVCALLAEKTGISPDRIYVKYEEVSHWGWNGNNF